MDFAGWEMPIRYRSIRDEHQAVRRQGGLFDVSHMGRFRVSGPDAEWLLERVLTRRVGTIPEGRCRYTLLCNEHGGTRDDGLVYRDAADWLLVVNSANRAKILDHIEACRRHADARVTDETTATAMIALQGPGVMGHLAGQWPGTNALKRFAFGHETIGGASALVSRTGYTGEDGVEIILPAERTEAALEALLEDLDAPAFPPVGLGARDTLRTEAGMPLYGHELSEEIDPLTAGLGFAVSWEKSDPSFVGQEALRRISEQGPERALTGLVFEGRRTPRQGMGVLVADRTVGSVTSGCFSPSLETPIAMALLDRDVAEPENEVRVDLGRQTPAGRVVGLPFKR